MPNPKYRRKYRLPDTTRYVYCCGMTENLLKSNFKLRTPSPGLTYVQKTTDSSNMINNFINSCTIFCDVWSWSGFHLVACSLFAIDCLYIKHQAHRVTGSDNLPNSEIQDLDRLECLSRLLLELFRDLESEDERLRLSRDLDLDLD